MAELKISGRMSVKKLKENFKNEFGGTLRIYDGREKADESATLASIRRNEDAKGGELICSGNKTVGGFEKEMLEVFGIKVQVATPDDWTLVLDGITLSKLKNIPEKTSKADMESLVAYKRRAEVEEVEDVKDSSCDEPKDGHEYVDLGLSVKWATCNVGASNPEDYGNYYAWGETSTKETYDKDNCPTFGLSISQLQAQGYIDGEGNFTSQYDAARANWGGSWRMPTDAEMQELIDKCTWKWMKQNGVKGYKVTGPNGNSIFLPVAGYRDGSSLDDAGSSGLYWSSTPRDDWNDYYAYYLDFSSDNQGLYSRGRDYGLSVRPVEKTSKADMESLVAYKRGSKEDESAEVEEVEEIGGEYLSVDADSTETQSMNEVELSINPTSAFRMSLFPIIGEEANQMIDDNGFDLDLFYDLEQLYIDDTERKYDIVVDFYSSSDGAEYFIDGGDAEEMEDNALVIDNGIANEEDGKEEDGDGFSDDFILVEKLKMEGSHSSISKDIFQDILDRHNEGLDDDHVDIIINAVQRQMKQVAEQLVSDGLVDDVDYVRFALQYGPMYGASYSCNIRTDEFYPEKLRVLNCEDWNDCNIPSTLQEHWPDRLLNNIVYDDKFYELECTGVDDFEFDVDLVNCYFESL